MKRLLAFLTCVLILCTVTACGVSQEDVSTPPTSTPAARPVTTTAATTTAATENSVKEYEYGIHLDEVEDYVKKYIRKSDNTSEYRYEYAKATYSLDDFFDDVKDGSTGYDLSVVADKFDIICDNGINYVKGQIGSSLERDYSLYKSDDELDDNEKFLLRTFMGMGENAESQINDWHSELSEIIDNAVKEERDLSDTEISTVKELYNSILDKVEIFSNL